MEAIESQLQPMKRNRVVLGEISNNTAACSSEAMKSVFEKISKPKCKSKKAKKTDVESPELFEEKTDEKLSDPQMCEAYVVDIYEYLHNMEVCNIFPLVSFILTHGLFQLLILRFTLNN